MPEYMAYLAMIVKCAGDFEGISWAQYDRAYRRCAVLTKDLHLNPTLYIVYSLCFAGKAKQNVVCAHCLSDSHSLVQCPENMAFPWEGMFVQPQSVVQSAMIRGVLKMKESLQTCHLFNAKMA